jgi:aryl-alcohol dehydrogenase-like predicted oxidoreductase
MADDPQSEVPDAEAAGERRPMPCGILGRTGIRVSRLFLGAMTFGEQGGVGAPPDECRRMVDAYEAAGGNVIDTASNYRGGASETIVGEVLEGRRERFVLATKYTVSRDAEDPNAAGNHRKNLVASLETSLGRLRTDYVDVLFVHLWDRHTPVDETMRALDDVVRAGKALAIGISDTPAWVVARANTIAEWRGSTPFSCVQVPYSVLERDIERDLLPMATSFGMTLAAWSPLANGVLSGKFTDGSSPTEGTRVDPAGLGEREHAAARAVQAVADDVGATPAQVAIAWTMARSPLVHPIVGARRLAQLEDNLRAVDLELPDEAVQRLESAVEFQRGFPHDFIDATAGWVFGAANDRLPT